mmetsp:Transcript_8933/g.27038  ORF Transcript_8933/g.27038 Transcript_8933/m.27038 type:complete len:238 (-) Transcript_8933:1842-2555(-)
MVPLVPRVLALGLASWAAGPAEGLLVTNKGKALWHLTYQAARGSGGFHRRGLASVGDVFEKRKEFTQEDVEAFVELTGDANPIHTVAGRGGNERAIVPGLLCSSLFPSIIGTTFPGSLYLGQTLRFRKKVYVGDAVVARLVVSRVQGRRTTFETTCVKEESGELAVDLYTNTKNMLTISRSQLGLRGSPSTQRTHTFSSQRRSRMWRRRSCQERSLASGGSWSIQSVRQPWRRKLPS